MLRQHVPSRAGLPTPVGWHPSHHPTAALLARSSRLSGSATRHHNSDVATGPHKAGWFGAFDQMESTYSAEGENAYRDQDPARTVEFGWDPGFVYPGFGNKPDALPKPWFHESASAGSLDAWQSHYPTVSGSIAGNRNVRNNAWRDTPEGWVQDYIPSRLTSHRSNGPGKKQAGWFDSSVNNVDGYGRRAVPFPDTPRSSLDWQGTGGPWIERAVNTSITCPGIGCVANASLQAFDANTEDAHNCRLNIGVHATDYDDDWSRENLAWTVNGYSVNALCDPMARGCNASAWRPLYSCLSEFEVDHLIDRTGRMMVQGKLSRMVDECPYEGNLLSAVAQVTCLVRLKIKPTPHPNLAVKQKKLVPPTLDVSAPLQCGSPGCTASTLLNIDPTIAMLGGACKMNVTLVQTDFDDHLGVPEQLDFLSLDGTGNLTQNVKPGKNPCTAAMQGKPLTPAEKVYSLVLNRDVTGAILKGSVGSLTVRGKISEMVDECASQDRFLLDGLVRVHCELPPGFKFNGTG